MKIIEFKSIYTYKYLWLKYVTGFDLNVHCAKCLLGEYSKKINVKLFEEDLIKNIDLDEHNSKYIYLCGVTKPYIWENNLHLALEHCEGSTVVFDECGAHAIIEDAKRIEIKPRIYYKHPNGRLQNYNTCRNWIFAYQQTIINYAKE